MKKEVICSFYLETRTVLQYNDEAMIDVLIEIQGVFFAWVTS